MALIKCPECGTTYSEYSPACLQCGYPTEKAKERGAERIEEVHTSIPRRESAEWSSQAQVQAAKKVVHPNDGHAQTIENVRTNASPTRLIETKISLHWIVEAYIFLGVIFTMVECYTILPKQKDMFVLTTDILYIGLFIISSIGVLFVKKWALFGIFSCRLIIMTLAVVALALTPSSALDPSVKTEFFKEIAKTLMLVGAFFIRKDGYSTYRALWYNGKKMIEIQDERDKQH
ncbi:MAG: hypothetical protein ACI4BD_09125 [Paludibacteraceae bacterium]